MKKRIIKVSSLLIPFHTFLVFLAGFLLALCIMFKIDADYTEELFDQLGKHILKEAQANQDNREQTVLRAMHTTYGMQRENKKNLFQYSPQSFKAKYMRSTDLDLLDVSGACGSASMVLARTYMAMNFPTRIGQMYANGHYAGHMVVEVWSNGRWMVLDPLFDQAFYKPDSTLASFKEVQHNFAHYAAQLHKDYPKEYKYQGVRYTNWEKFPLLSPLLKQVMVWHLGQTRTEQFCMRKYFIRFHQVWFYVFLTMFLGTLGVLAVQWRMGRNA
jgi:hypothetical protein